MSTAGRAREGFKARFPSAQEISQGTREIDGNLKGGRHTPPQTTGWPGAASALEDVFRDRRRQRRGAGWQAEVIQNFPCGIGWMNRGQNPEAAPASFTLQDVQRENSHHEQRPRIIARRRHRGGGGSRFGGRFDGL